MMALLSLVLCASGPPTGSPLADIGPAPAVHLVDSAGHPFALASLRGKVVLVGFAYSTCNGSCPMATAAMDRVRRSLRDEGLWGSQVEFVTITLDPIRDTPEALAAYARAYRADPKVWHFLTGPPAEVARVVAAWDMWARPLASGMIDHPSRAFLIDPKGHRREIYDLRSMTPAAVVRDVKELLAEEDRPR